MTTRPPRVINHRSFHSASPHPRLVVVVVDPTYDVDLLLELKRISTGGQ